MRMFLEFRGRIRATRKQVSVLFKYPTSINTLLRVDVKSIKN